MKKDLLLDVDEVVCFPGFLEAVNSFMKTNYVIDDFTDYYIDKVAIPDDRFDEFNCFLDSINLYENACVLPDAVETIEALNKLYNVYILSACVNPFNVLTSGRAFKDKYDFLIELLSFINPERFIFTSSKQLVKADIIIDDRVPNLCSDIETKILFPSYHNKDIPDSVLEKHDILRAGYDWRNGWNEVGKMLIDDEETIRRVLKK